MGNGGEEQATNNRTRQPVSQVVDRTGCIAGDVTDYSILMYAKPSFCSAAICTTPEGTMSTPS